MKSGIKVILLITGLVFFSRSNAQTTPFNLILEPVNVDGLVGLQSFAVGQYDGKWLLIGGRLDGLHIRQPFASFDIAGHNTQLIVVDPETLQKWSTSLTSLPISIQEQLQSTNMEFYQNEDYLYLVGGYGYSATIADYTTFDKLTAVDVPSTINAIINNTSITDHFRQITDDQFQVTGGGLDKINNTYYLVGGQKFLGRYNPMGPDHGPGFIQEYTNQIRKFQISDDGNTITIDHLPSLTDAINLHRRDYNETAQIFPDGAEGLTAFSGVFQTSVNFPYLNCVNIDSTGYNVNNDFSQYFNHYHCANVPLYSATHNEMHTVFFGGIAQYYENLGIIIQDDNVPFVKTIARVTRDSEGNMVEYKLPIEMPSFLGAGSEFISVQNLPKYNNGVIKMDEIIGDTILLGYIYGGISSSAENIFFVNDGTQSIANSQIFKVYFTTNAALGIHDLNEHSKSTLKIRVYPNPNEGNFTVSYILTKNTDLRYTLLTVDGKKIEEKIFSEMPPGEYTFEQNIKDINIDGTYLITLETNYEKFTQKIIIK
ncbi:MAG: T9SS type A sorting domain-containing protein [Chitinophagales bacterium]|nr:T9SS type A sorting domain-containing protein [Chitinophagales bacterium]